MMKLMQAHKGATLETRMLSTTTETGGDNSGDKGGKKLIFSVFYPLLVSDCRRLNQ